ncbi:MAG: 23S rRNA (pseudouridine(1915)-N(3))-methyltransferase RlmH [Gammaproteobacteria bacterium]|nr:23S rRNA (pseudouridine(1915)-N(3))-methyltransferase RlmH [Gammaproteobacteria bacterium]
MKVHLISVAQRAPKWVDEGYKEYEKRLPKEIQLVYKQIQPIKSSSKLSSEKKKELEGEKILSALPKYDWLISLDEKGKEKTTQEWSFSLSNWLQHYPDVCVLIGGADGLSENIIKLSNERLSLSKMTFPHTLVRILFAEQLYRAWTLLNGHPYHRE